MKLENMKKSETTEQIHLFNWAACIEYALPELKLMYHVPNEGKRKNGSIIKAMGIKKGVPDIALPVPRNGYHGLYIEMKFEKNKVTQEQEEFMNLLQKQNYKAEICYSFDAAKKVILNYLQEDGKQPLENCINAPWINGKCEGIYHVSELFTKEECYWCKKRILSNAEKIINHNFAQIDRDPKKETSFITDSIKTDIFILAFGVEVKGTNREYILETINKRLARLVKRENITIIQSAKVLEVALEAYTHGKRGALEDE